MGHRGSEVRVVMNCKACYGSVDSMNGGWSLIYDNVNRASAATATSGVWNHLTLSWTYDSFGNRKTQTPTGQNIAAPVPQAQTFSYPSQNRISNYGVNGYDAAGNVLYDQINNYLYDPEGRLCAVSYFNGTTTEYMLYLYDGEGRRVAKVSNPTFSCTPGTGSTLMETYLLGPSGEHITELGQTGAFLRSNVYANGRLLATYTNDGTYFSLSDWLGSKRVVTKYDGTVAQMCMNLPFGDELMCSATDLSEHHFTGQIHDQESGNDYFNARYYSNNTGRFMSTDPRMDVRRRPNEPPELEFVQLCAQQSSEIHRSNWDDPLRLRFKRQRRGGFRRRRYSGRVHKQWRLTRNRQNNGHSKCEWFWSMQWGLPRYNQSGPK